MTYSDDIRQFHIAYERIKDKSMGVPLCLECSTQSLDMVRPAPAKFIPGFPYKNKAETKPVVFRVLV